MSVVLQLLLGQPSTALPLWIRHNNSNNNNNNNHPVAVFLQQPLMERNSNNSTIWTGSTVMLCFVEARSFVFAPPPRHNTTTGTTTPSARGHFFTIPLRIFFLCARTIIMSNSM
jgi:hypothetical protein